MPKFAQPVKLHGDPTSLSIGADLNSILLRIPLEIWLHIFDDKIEVTDLTHLRTINRTFWVVTERLMPHVAARMHPSHANDPQINDSFFAEAVIAAHRLNVQSPLDTLLRRDGSLDSALPDASWLVSQQGQHSSGPKADSTIASPDEKQAAAHPTRADWSIGSRRMLHLAEARGLPAKFGLCTTCKRGDCRVCLRRSGRLKQVKMHPAMVGRPATGTSLAGFSRAIWGEDAFLCKECWYEHGESTARRMLRCPTLIRTPAYRSEWHRNRVPRCRSSA